MELGNFLRPLVAGPHHVKTAGKRRSVTQQPEQTPPLLLGRLPRLVGDLARPRPTRRPFFREVPEEGNRWVLRQEDTSCDARLCSKSGARPTRAKMCAWIHGCLHFFLLAGWYVLPQSKQIKALKCPPKLGVSPVSPICHSPLRALAPCYIGGSIRVGKGGTDLGFADWLSNSRLCVD